VDPLTISIEFLFKPSRTGVIYAGDPEFEQEFESFVRAKFHSVIVRHFAFQRSVYEWTRRKTSHITLKRTYTTDGELSPILASASPASMMSLSPAPPKGASSCEREEELQIFHVCSKVSEEDLRAIGSLHVVDFELNGADLADYVFHQLRMGVTWHQAGSDDMSGDVDISEEEGKMKANRFSKLSAEIERYSDGSHSLTNMHQIRASVGEFKRILSDVVKDGKGALAATASHAKTLETFSAVAADSIACIRACPLDNLTLPPLKALLPQMAAAYESLFLAQPEQGKEVKNAATGTSPALTAPTTRDVALRLAEDWAKELTGGMGQTDFASLSLFLVLFLHLHDVGVDAEELSTALRDLSLGHRHANNVLAAYFSSCPPTFVADSLRSTWTLLAAKDALGASATIANAAEQVLGVARASNANLEKIYSQSRCKIVMIRVRDRVLAYERLSAFADRQRQQQQSAVVLGEPVIVDTSSFNVDHLWLIEEAMFSGLWIALFVDDRSDLNYVRFLMEKCQASSNQHAKGQSLDQQQRPQHQVHDAFRLWLLCEGSSFGPLTSLTSPTHCVALSERKSGKSKVNN